MLQKLTNKNQKKYIVQKMKKDIGLAYHFPPL